MGLTALQRDLLRAGYLATCLLLFRRRPQLSAPGGAGGALFGRLVGFNFAVLAAEGLFQVGGGAFRGWGAGGAGGLGGGGGGAGGGGGGGGCVAVPDVCGGGGGRDRGA